MIKPFSILRFCFLKIHCYLYRIYKGKKINVRFIVNFILSIIAHFDDVAVTVPVTKQKIKK